MKAVFSVQCSIVVGALAVFAAVASAQEVRTNAPGGAACSMYPIIVTATRLPEKTVPVPEFPANVTVILREAIEASPALTVQDLLHTRAGLMPLDTTGLGQDARLSLRGYGEKPGVLVLVDGVRVNHAGSGDFLGNLVLPGDLERIEIIRGGASTTYGEGAVGGVVNLITRGAHHTPLAGAVAATAGSFGLYTARARVSGSTNDFSYYLAAERREWDGWRDFSGFRGWNVVAKPAIETAAGKFTLNYRFHDEFNEIPGNLRAAQYAANPRASDPTRQSTFDVGTHQLSLEWADAPLFPFDLAGRVHGQFQRGVGTFGGVFVNTNTQPNLGGALQQTWRVDAWDRHHTLSFGQEVLLQEYRNRDNFGSHGTADSLTLGAFAQAVVSLPADTTLTLGTRLDYREWDIAAFSPGFYDFTTRRTADVWSPKLTLQTQLPASTTGWLSLSRAYRLPGGDDISAINFTTFPPVGFALPNPNVAPVDARTVELGWRMDPSCSPFASVTAFYSQVENDLFFDPTPAASAITRNADSERKGVEMEFHTRLHDRVLLSGAAAWTDARFRSGAYDGNRLTLVPEWNLTAGITLLLANPLTWRWEVTHIAGQPPANDVQAAFARNSYTVLNTRLSYRWKRATAFAAVNNVTDTRYEQFPAVGHPFAGAPFRAFNPAPGVGFQLGLGAEF